MRRILFLSSKSTLHHVVDLKHFLRANSRDIELIHQTHHLPSLELAQRYHYLVSYGFQKRITPQLIDYFEGKNRPIINLHRSFLPYNRNLYADLWSMIDRTPTGVTIHQVNRSYDRGKILVQRQLELSDSLTYGQSERLIHYEMKQLFTENWDKIVNNEITPFEQDHRLATSHLLSDLPPLEQLMPSGRQTTRADIKRNAALKGYAAHCVAPFAKPQAKPLEFPAL